MVPLSLAILVDYLSMTTKTPNVITCDQCGKLSAVEGWDPVYEDPLPTDSVYTPRIVKEINYEIRCNKCGTRVQAMSPPQF